MKAFIKSPLLRISASISMLVVSLLLATEFLGLFPNTKNSDLTHKKVIAETLAVHLALEIGSDDTEKMSEILRTAVSRNKIIKSVAIRNINGNILQSYGSHDINWTLPADANSNAAQVRIPLFENSLKVANVEIAYVNTRASQSLWDKRASFLSVTLFMSLFGFFAFLIFLKRTLSELDTEAVIPERVRNALDTLAEGLLIINREGYIVFSNSAFASVTGLTAADLIGKNSASLSWEQSENGQLPWQPLLEGSAPASGSTVKLRTGYEQLSTFTVNATPIAGRADEIRGALVTFNDITEIQIKNAELQNALTQLEKSQLEITRQNKELEYLATRDPLTGSLNRRSFFAGFDAIFAEATENREELTCIMTDIDKFKSVNDTFGHGVGDDVIKYLSNVMADNSRPTDLVGRFGGEEFCMILPGTSLLKGHELAEKIRIDIETGVGADFWELLQITASFGVASIHSGADKPNDMVEQADRALYFSKEHGRNQVTSFSATMNQQGSAVQSAQSVPILKNVTDTLAAGKTKVADKTTSGTPAEAAQRATQSTESALPPKGTPTPVLAIKPSAVADIDKLSIDDLIKKPKKSGVPILAVNSTPMPKIDDPIRDEKKRSRPVEIPDRSLLVDRVDQAVQHAERNQNIVSVLFISAAAIHRVNDTLGFTVSCKLLNDIISRIHHTMNMNNTIRITGGGKQAYTVSRFSEDELCLTLNSLQHDYNTESVIDIIHDAFKRTFSIDGHEIYVATDVGVACYPEHGPNADILIRNANIAAREARDTVGQNNVCYYTESISERQTQHIRLETDLHQALFRNELFLVYQPKVDLRSGVIIGMEALIRWKHPELGIVSPGLFIPIAERTGLIDSISHWVTRVVCAQISSWIEAGFDELVVAVNISPVEMRNDSLSDNILHAIQEFDIPASCLEVEVTESVAMDDMKKAVKTLQKLDRQGVRISIDDFGTGYASLSYLKSFPITKVKIDRSFVSDFKTNAADARIVSGVIAMSHSLGVKVICEGVEEEEQLRFLQDHHCDEVQGNLVSLPLQRREATELLTKQGKIKRLIRDYNVADIGLAAITTTGDSAVISGVLNSFPQAAINDNDDREDQQVLEQ